MPRMTTIDTGEISLRCAIEGDGPLVILVHGFPESWYSWRHQIGPIAEAGFTACAIDVRGYFVAAGNVRDYGTRLFPFMQNARVDDGLLDVIVVQTRDLRELLNIGTQVLARTHLRNPKITAFQTGRDILVEALDAAVPMHVDAELLERGTHSRIRVQPAAISVVY